MSPESNDARQQRTTMTATTRHDSPRKDEDSIEKGLKVSGDDPEAEDTGEPKRKIAHGNGEGECKVL